MNARIASRYALTRTLTMSLAEANERVRAALAAEGFGVLTEIDVAATLKKKLGVDRRPYLILGACNPTFADHALATEPAMGVLLPCNVTLFEGEDGNRYIQAIDPAALFTLVDRPELQATAADVRARLTRALDAVAGPA